MTKQNNPNKELLRQGIRKHLSCFMRHSGAGASIRTVVNINSGTKQIVRYDVVCFAPVILLLLAPIAFQFPELFWLAY